MPSHHLIECFAYCQFDTKEHEWNYIVWDPKVFIKENVLKNVVHKIASKTSSPFSVIESSGSCPCFLSFQEKTCWTKHTNLITCMPGIQNRQGEIVDAPYNFTCNICMTNPELLDHFQTLCRHVHNTFFRFDLSLITNGITENENKSILFHV